jgi:hypothetical protein
VPIWRALLAYAASACAAAVMGKDLLQKASRRKLLRHAIALLIGIAPATCAFGQAVQADEARVKAAYLLRFLQYVEWPQEALQPGGAAVKIGIVGAPAINAELVQAARGGQGRAVTVQSLSGAENLSQFHVVFIGDDDRAKLAPLIAAVRGKPTLVITESPSALEHGSMINFVTMERRVKFEIALDTAERAGLALSSRLLAVALRVHKGELERIEALAAAKAGRPAT